MTKKIVLISMIKNESKIILRSLESLKTICDGYVFLDTGSTDNTVELLEKFLEGKFGKVYEDKFVNFGYSRTKSFEVCKEFLKGECENLEEWYGLFLDADMNLVVQSSFNKEILRKNGYRIIQKNGSLSYYNLRFAKMSVDWKCKGVTHEYWDGGNEDIECIDDTIIYIDDKNDGGCKTDKFERDKILLEKGLVDEPDNVRYFFYLAQTYESFDRKKSVELYKKRAEMGGWFEEIFISYLRMGRMCINDLNEPEKGIYYLLLAYEKDNNRAESLWSLSNYYRNNGFNNLATKFAILGKTIQYPKHRSLFIENDVYDYKLDEELSIAGFYTDHKDIGYHSSNKLLFTRNLPEYIYGMTMRNIYFYIENIKSFDKYELKIENKHNNYLESSSSICKIDNKNYYGILRTVNYSINDDGSYLYKDEYKNPCTINYLYNYSEITKLTNVKELKINVPKRRESHIKGLEDMRLFKGGNNWYAFATTFEWGEYNHPCQVLCYINNNTIDKIVPLNYKTDICQKNWCPFYDKKNDKIMCIYSYEPFIMLEIDRNSGECKEHINKNQKYRLNDIRGSSSPIWDKEERCWYVVVHIVHFLENRKYIHRILSFNENWDLLKISYPFSFESKFVEYCLGFEKYDINTFILNYSVRDNKSYFVKINKEEIKYYN